MTFQSEIYGNFEDLPSDDEGEYKGYVVRVLGHNIGVAKAWMHHGAWAIIAIDFVPGDGFTKLYEDPIRYVEGMGLLLDFYTGRFVLLGGVIPDNPPEKWQELASGPIISDVGGGS